MMKRRTIQKLFGDSYYRTILKGRDYERAVAVDDVLDKVRELLKATGITAEMVCIDELRVLMGRVDDG